MPVGRAHVLARHVLCCTYIAWMLRVTCVLNGACMLHMLQSPSRLDASWTPMCVGKGAVVVPLVPSQLCHACMCACHVISAVGIADYMSHCRSTVVQALFGVDKAFLANVDTHFCAEHMPDACSCVARAPGMSICPMCDTCPTNFSMHASAHALYPHAA